MSELHRPALVAAPDYAGAAGVAQVRALQQAMVLALQSEDWLQVRRLDRACGQLVERVIAANRTDGTSLTLPLSELKGVYANLIQRCQQEVAALAG